MKKRTVLFAATLLIISSNLLTAGGKLINPQADSTAARRYPPKRTYVTSRTNSAPKIDGKLDDECWKGGGWDSFIFQKEPVDGGLPTEKTLIKVVYDDYYIYCAAKCYDSEPEKISKLLYGRDSFTGDLIGFCFDSYYDRRTSFEFGITAAGSKFDNTTMNGNITNLNWNAVWDGKASIEDSAWIAELKIPFSQLSFTEKDIYTWGFMVWRWIYRKGEEDDWGTNPITASTWVDHYGDITGIKGIKTPSRIELLPYTLGKYRTYQKEDGNPFKSGTERSLDFGLDTKIGLTSNFNLDLTINPDFGQVEADPSQISLTSYELEYEEKRPFFIEGSGILNFSPLYYPRRIGHAPSYIPSLGPNEYVESMEQTTILGAAKITGKTNDGLSIGVLESVTAKENADIQTLGGRNSTTVEPLTNYFVGRVQKEYDNSNIIIGGILTAVNRDIQDAQLKFLTDASYTGGIDFTYKWSDKDYYISGNLLGSYISGDKAAITRVQLSPAHYFQRPDASYLSLDTNRTSLAGYGGKLEFGKSGGNEWRYSESVTWYSPNFEVNDIGYLPNSDEIKQSSAFGYVVKSPAGILRKWSAYLEQNSTWNFGGDNCGFSTGLYSDLTFTNMWNAHIDLLRNFSSLDPSLIWAGPLLKVDGSWCGEFNASTDDTKPFSFGIESERIIHDEKLSEYTHLASSLTYRITNGLSVSAKFYYDFTRNNLQYIETQNKNDVNYYFMGSVDQDVVGITARVSLYLTPDLSIQYYGSPFSATRKYSNIKKATNTRAKNYFDRYYAYNQDQINFNNSTNSYQIDENVDGQTDFTISNPDMSRREFRSNLVIRWEYNPGSTIYLVWSQNRSMESEYESTSIGKAINRVFSIYPDDVFMIKLNHWFSL